MEVGVAVNDPVRITFDGEVVVPPESKCKTVSVAKYFRIHAVDVSAIMRNRTRSLRRSMVRNQRAEKFCEGG